MTADATRPKILIFSPYYTPFFKGGGPIQSMANLVNRLFESFNFYIVTGDRDLGDEGAPRGLAVERWERQGGAFVYRIKPEKLTLIRLRRLINAVEPDVIYVNGLFSLRFSIGPLLLHRLRQAGKPKVIVAPRGELYPGALGIKRAKKAAFLLLAKTLRLHACVTWHATAAQERNQIREHFPGFSRTIVLASNLSSAVHVRNTKMIVKNAGQVRLVFVSRIVPKKGLDVALDALKDVEGNVNFKIYGPLEDADYWSECLRAIAELPPMISASYEGVLQHDDVYDRISAAHVFVLPTRGENFGHVIAEALAMGCPVVTSDQTPWTDLDVRGAGRTLPLRSEQFARVLQEYVDMEDSEYKRQTIAARAYARELIVEDSIVVQYVDLLGRQPDAHQEAPQ